jgi:hypothetical protein
MNFNQEDVDMGEAIAGEYRHNWNAIARGLNEINIAIQQFTDMERIVLDRQIAGENVVMKSMSHMTAEEEVLDRIYFLIDILNKESVADVYFEWCEEKMDWREAQDEQFREVIREDAVFEAERQTKMDV